MGWIMQLREYLANINKVSINKLEEGHALTVKELFITCVEPNLPKQEIVLAWHRLLIRYIHEPDAIFFVRRYASASNKDWLAIRRGFLTKYEDGTSYVFCDNYLAQYFYTMAMDRYVPSYEDFKNTIAERKFPYGCRTTKEEGPHQAYKTGKSSKINSAGWKLAHILSVNESDYSIDYKQNVDKFLPRGDPSEWLCHEGDDYPSRKIDRAISADELTMLRAHFLRLSHPINYFLVPARGNEISRPKSNIGEVREMLAYVYEHCRATYGEVFHEYLREVKDGSSFGNESSTDWGDTQIDITYGFGVGKPSENGKAISVGERSKQVPGPGITQEQLIAMAKLYLEESVSFRNLEIRVLKIDSPVRGGGFIAKTALNDFGIEAKHKGTIKLLNIEQEIEKAEGVYKSALVWLYRS